jgi:hypothetical protein
MDGTRFMQISNTFLTTSAPVYWLIVFQLASEVKGNQNLNGDGLTAAQGGTSGLQVLESSTNLAGLYTPNGSGWKAPNYTSPNLVVGNAYCLAFAYNGTGIGVDANFSMAVDGSALPYNAEAHGAGSSTAGLSYVGGDGFTGVDSDLNGYLLDVAYFNTIPSAGDQAALLSYFRSKWNF